MLSRTIAALGLACVSLASHALAAVNVWSPLGPDGGSVSAVAFAAPPSTVFAGTSGAGVFRSVDAGDHWTAVNQGLDERRVRALAVVPGTSVLLAGTESGLYVSPDGGDGWSLVRFPAAAPLGPVTSVAVDPNNPLTRFAGVAGAVVRSTDGGVMWTVGKTGLPVGKQVAAIAIGSGRLFAGVAGGGAFESIDGGATWSPRNVGLDDLDVTALAFDPTTDQTIYAATDGGVFRTTDAGAHWALDADGLGSLDVRSVAAVDPHPGNATNPGRVYAATAAGVFRQDSNDDTWTNASTGLPSASVNGLAINPNPTDADAQKLLAATDVGVARTTNGGNAWSPKSAGLAHREVALVSLAGTSLYAGTLGDGLFRKTAENAPWTDRNAGLPNLDVRAFATAPSNRTTQYVVTAAGLAKSVGSDWTAVGAIGSADVRALAVDTGNPSVVYAATPIGVRKSIDGGATWNGANVGLLNLDVRALVLLGGANPATATLYAATAGGLFKSVDAGGAWTPLPGAGLFLTAIAIDASDTSAVVLYVASNDAVFRSSDGGLSWTARTSGLPSKGLRDLALAPGRPDVVFAATDGGVYATANGGARWAPLVSGLPTPDVRRVIVDDATPTTAYVATGGNGVYALTLIACTDDAQCDDGSLCTLEHRCDRGDTAADATGCVRVVKDCSPPNPLCYEPVSCNPSTGVCGTIAKKPNNTPCDDGNICTIGDVCQNGICKSGPGPNCDDGNPCTADGCDLDGQCTHQPLDDGTPCEGDNDKCTVGDFCSSGHCQIGPRTVCEAVDQCHSAGVCSHATGICSSPLRPSGVPCEDGDYCTVNDYCSVGSCLPGGPRQCADTKACTIDHCDSGQRQCLHVPNVGADCDDSDPCTTGDQCTAEGTCHGAPTAGGQCTTTTTTTRTTTTKTSTTTTTRSGGTSTTAPAPCTAAADCPTTYPCDDEQCLDGVCRHPELTGFTGLQCRLKLITDEPLCATGEIDGDVSGHIADRLIRTRKLIERAWIGAKPPKRRRLLHRSVQLLKSVEHLIGKGLRTGAVSGMCASRLDGSISGLTNEARSLPTP